MPQPLRAVGSVESTRTAALSLSPSKLSTMKKNETSNAVKCVEIRCKKTANAVPAVKEIKDSWEAAEFARKFYHDDLNIYESFFLILMN